MSGKRKPIAVSKRTVKRYTNPMDKYNILEKIAGGSYGEVSKCRIKSRKTFVAIKDFILEGDSNEIPENAQREVKVLKKLKHKHIVEMIETITRKSRESNTQRVTQCCIVLEYCPYELGKLIKTRRLKIALDDIKVIMEHIISGVTYMHSKKVIHRDLKPANILISTGGKIKIADFGLSIFTEPTTNKYTNNVVSLWYRAPEILLGEEYYNNKIDVWSVGCILGELFIRHPIMAGTDEKHQLEHITDYCGSITPEVWPKVTKLGNYSKFDLPQGKEWKVPKKVNPPMTDKHALDLISKMLVLDPNKRIDMKTSSDHDFFYAEPLAWNIFDLLNEYDEIVSASTS